MITVLFDIDGTLIRTGGAGMLAIKQAMGLFFPVDAVPPVPVHGRTDAGILSDLFNACSRNYSDFREPFNQAYWNQLPLTLRQTGGSVLPGVEDLLGVLQATPDVVLGLLTGNAEAAAWIKLRHFELDSYFHFGGFGDHEADRNRVADRARQAAAAYVGTRFREDQIWVIGDTIHDIRCARSIHARVVAVETGGADRAQLQAERPDLLLPTLEDTRAFMQQVIHASGPGHAPR